VEVQFEIQVRGRVQGVGFRYFVQKKAAEQHIKGWVKNMPDGSVLVMARGNEPQMNTFIGYLEAGPSMARVEKLIKSRMPELESFANFKVKY
jgi:acylphosphatase